MNKLGYILDSNIVDSKGNPPRISTLAQFLVWKFHSNPAKANWGKEIKMANRMLAQCGDVQFWNSVELDFKVSSLIWFLTESGARFLEREYQHYVFLLEGEKKLEIKTPEPKIKPVAPTTTIIPKPKTLFDFIKRKSNGT